MISVVTVTYHTGSPLWPCIESLLRQPEVAEVILVINGAGAGTRALLEKRAAADGRIRLIDPGRNLGFAPGCNLGVAYATYDYLAFVNPDCSVGPGTFNSILSVFAEQPNVWLVGARLQFPDGREQRGARREFLTPWRAFVELARLDLYFPRHPYFRRLNMLAKGPMDDRGIVPVVSGAFMVTRKDLYERIGGMDDNFFLHCDDLDLCLRIHQHGGEVWYAGNVPIVHYRSTSEVSSIFVEWHKTRSCSYYFRKHFRSTYPVWVLSLLSAALWIRFCLMAIRLLPRRLGATIPHGA